MTIKYFYAFLFCLLITAIDFSQTSHSRTYCNPMNIDYAYNNIPDFVVNGKHRTTADPVITLYKDKYFLFSTNQYGYWWSTDLDHWKFIPRDFLRPYIHSYDNLCAPATVVLGDTLLVIGSTYSKDFPLWMSINPTVDDWKVAVDSFKVGAWDPAFFLDDDGRLYIYFGSSNVYPIYGQEIDRHSFQPIGEKKGLIKLNDNIHGWERFGENADNTFLRPFIEGSWMNKYKGKYYLQFAAPGTEFSWYADGVYVGSNPFGPFKYQPENPFSSKPGGFARGAGHGATFQDKYGNWWHVSTIAIGVKNNFERRIGFWPAGFDEDGILYCNTAYGDYPHYLPDSLSSQEKFKDSFNCFTGWMLLNYNKPVMTSSTYGGYAPNFGVDENIKTYWSAVSGKKGEWFQSDLGSICTVNAVQINYADQDAELMGKQLDIYHQYIIYKSDDGKNWDVLIDKSKNKSDVPYDYVELNHPVKARYLKIENIHLPTGKFALSGFRVFGKGNGKVPDTVKNFIVLRENSERRNAWLKWKQSEDAIGYTIYAGAEQDKLYINVMIYCNNEYYFTAMDRNKPYYFQIEAFNENGLGKRTKIVKVE